PVLKIVRPHLGTDYAAPSGTPVQAIGAGTVVFAARSGASGNMVKLRHANGYETMYLHLSRILVRSGQRVEQGQGIGLVGSTGLSTGPHLDFRMTRNGRFVNFERLRLPPATSVSAQKMADFHAERERFLALMQWPDGTPETMLASAPPAGSADASQQGGQ
ncbi:MAG TPA: M23 family metallopeptidase, partial [Bryobacteraceae bacterium]|nr:M23 family metallopeptidase [Bryobacteraceae bacterium]